MFDETITAFGRTGEWFAACHWPDATPDIITFAKGVTSGIVPFSGVLVSGAVAELFEQSAEGFPYGHTFSGYPLGCAVAAEAIRVIRDEDLVAESRRKGALLRERLDALAADVAAHRRRARARAPAGARARRRIARRWPRRRAPPRGSSPPAASAGSMIYSCPTPLGTTTIEAVMLAPPLTIADAELDEVVAILGDALAATA